MNGIRIQMDLEGMGGTPSGPENPLIDNSGDELIDNSGDELIDNT